MPQRVARLMPGRGLDLTRIDDRAIQGNPLRGCENVRVVDGEWWSREGDRAKRRGVIGVPWVHAISLDLIDALGIYRRHFLIYSGAVLEVDVDNDWAISVPYAATWSGTVGCTKGSAYVTIATTAAGAVAAGFVILLNDSDDVTTAYRVTSVTGTGSAAGDKIYLHQAYLGSSAAGYTSYSYATWGVLDDEPAYKHIVNWTVFRQQVTLAEGAVWDDNGGAAATAPYYTEHSPSVAKGGIYLVVTGPPNANNPPGSGPVAIRLDGVPEQAKFSFMRKTQSSVTAAVAFGASNFARSCEVFKGRLIIARGDDSDRNNERTVWYSQDGNLLYWHTGTAGGTPAATHNLIRLSEGHDPISGMAKLGDMLVVHRDRSQELFQYNSSEVAPFIVRRNDQALGCVSSKSLINVRGQHLFWSEYGPASFDGNKVVLLDPGIQQVAAAHRTTSEWCEAEYSAVYVDGEGTLWPRGLEAVYHAARQQIWWRMNTVADRLAYDNIASRYLVYDLVTGAMWLHSYGSAYSLGIFRLTDTGREVVVRSWLDGTVSQASQTDVSSDSGASRGSGNNDEPGSYVMTKWHDFGSPNEKEILKLQIELRALPSVALFSDDVATNLDLTADGNFNYQLRIWADHNVGNSPYVQTVSIDIDTYEDAQLLQDGTRIISKFIELPKVRLRGEVFKFAFDNVGNEFKNRRPFRLSQISVFYEERDEMRRERNP